MLLNMMAAIVPTSVEFHIHQVVPVFHTNKPQKDRPKKPAAVLVFSAAINSGTNATKIKGINGDTGHAAKSNNPLTVVRMKADFFNLENLETKFGIKNKRAPHCMGALFDLYVIFYLRL